MYLAHLTGYAVIAVGVVTASVFITSAIIFTLQKKYDVRPRVSVFILTMLGVFLTLVAILFLKASRH